MSQQTRAGRYGEFYLDTDFFMLGNSYIYHNINQITAFDKFEHSGAQKANVYHKQVVKI